MPDPKTLSTNQAARIAGVSRQTIHNWMAARHRGRPLLSAMATVRGWVITRRSLAACLRRLGREPVEPIEEG